MPRKREEIAGPLSDDTSTSSSPAAVETREFDAAWAARWQWQYLAGHHVADRIAIVVGQVWQRGYRAGFHDAYAVTARRAAATARQAAEQHRDAALALTFASAAASAVADRECHRAPMAPPTDPRVLAAAHTAAATNEQQPWKPLAHTVWAGGIAAGRDRGALDAAVDILIDWEQRGGISAAARVTIGGQSAIAWIKDLLAASSRRSPTGTVGIADE